jgi:hypothetical protein
MDTVASRKLTLRVDAGVLREVVRDDVLMGCSFDTYSRHLRLLARATGIDVDVLAAQAQADAELVASDPAAADTVVGGLKQFLVAA